MDANLNNDLKESIREGVNNPSSMYDDKLSYRDILQKDILELMGFSSDLTKEKKDELHKKIEEMLENRVAEQIFDRLSEIERNEYDRLLIEQKNDEAYKYLQGRGIIPEQILTAEALIMKLEFYEDSKVVRDEAQKKINDKQQGAMNG